MRDLKKMLSKFEAPERKRESKKPSLNSFLKTFFSFVIFATFFFLAQSSVYAATYFVSVADGNDTNCTGLSQTAYPGGGPGIACPWKTIAKVNSSAFIAGDTISFKTGETWREQLTVPSSGSLGSPITFNSYGSTGAKPKIYGSTNVGALNWDQTPLNPAGSKDILNETYNATATGGHAFGTAGTGYLDNTGWAGTLGSGSVLDADNTDITDPLGGSSQLLNVQKVSPNYDSEAKWDAGSTKAITYFDTWVYISASGLTNLNQTNIIKSTTTGDSNKPYWVVLNKTAGENLNYQMYLYNNGASSLVGTTANILTGVWHELEIKYDATNLAWGFKMDGVAVAGGSLTGTLYSSPRYWRLGKAGDSYTGTYYYDNTNISSDNWQTGITSLPANTWKATFSSSRSVWFIDSDGTVHWGKKATDLSSVANLYDWYADGSYIYIYTTDGAGPGHAWSSVESSSRDAGVTASQDATKQYITIDNLDIRYAGKYGIQTGGLALGWTITNNNISYISLKENSYADGIQVNGGTAEISGNAIHDIGTHGIYVEVGSASDTVDGVTVENNTIYNVYHSGIDVMNIHGTLQNVTVRNNKYYNTTDYDTTYTTRGIYLSGDQSGSTLDTVNVYNNLIYNICNGGIYVGGASGNESNINIYNNTVYERLSTCTVGTWAYLISDTMSSGTNNFKNNIGAQTNNTSGSQPINIADSSKITGFDNNLFYRWGYGDPNCRGR